MINFDIIKETDPEIYNLIWDEFDRQDEGLELIASENTPSESVLLAQASYHTLKYAEGYPGKRYYGGCSVIDKTEQLAIDRACKLFKCNYANVQPHSGAQANMAVQFALCKPGDIIMGMSLNSGGHLTHGAKPTFSGKYFKSVQYEVSKDTYEIDYTKLEDFIVEHKPKLFIAGASAYPREIDFRRIRVAIDNAQKRINNQIYMDRTILDSDIPSWINSAKIYFMVDMAHIAGLVATDLHQSPIPYADVVTSTTHKTLRGPRGGLILWNDDDLTKRINSAIFPGCQGGPLENIIAAKAVCFGEALQPEFKIYQQQVITNAKELAQMLIEYDFDVLTGGTDNHLVLLDLRNKHITGKELERRLEQIRITTNKNAIPFDMENKMVTSGIRLGTPAVTSRGLKESDMRQIAFLINGVIDDNSFENNKDTYKFMVQTLCEKYPLYR